MANFNSNTEVIQGSKNYPQTSRDRTVGYAVPSSAKADQTLRPKPVKQLEENIGCVCVWGEGILQDTLSTIHKRVNRLDSVALYSVNLVKLNKA